jgi:hypothetical protein
MDGKRIKAVQLHIFVREDPASAESKKGAASLSSLYDLNLIVTTPQIVTKSGPYFCPVAQPVKAAEWNNSDAIQKPVGIFELQRDTDVLEIRGSSRNATWQGVVVLHSNGDWEESLTGWIKTASGTEPISVEETRKNTVTIPRLKDRIELTPDLLTKYGVPSKERFDPAVDTCPQPSS